MMTVGVRNSGKWLTQEDPSRVVLVGVVLSSDEGKGVETGSRDRDGERGSIMG